MLDEDNGWEKDAIRDVLLKNIAEQRRSRRWSIFFKILIFGYIGWITAYFMQKEGVSIDFSRNKDHTAQIDIVGPIMDGEEGSAENIIFSLDMAMESKGTKGVVFRINSPGGSPVQARRIYDRIMFWKEKNPDVKVYAAIEDMGTSAAYLIASAAEKIYADQTSLVGSVGVLINSFGFSDAIEKLGVERRLYKAGEHKGILDPFLPRNAEEDSYIQKQINFVHQKFIENVKVGRGSRLKEDPLLFSGLFWAGGQAKELGLVDGFGDVTFVAKEVIQEENIVNYSQGIGFLERLAQRMGSSFGHQIATELGLVQFVK